MRRAAAIRLRSALELDPPLSCLGDLHVSDPRIQWLLQRSGVSSASIVPPRIHAALTEPLAEMIHSAQRAAVLIAGFSDILGGGIYPAPGALMRDADGTAQYEPEYDVGSELGAGDAHSVTVGEGVGSTPSARPAVIVGGHDDRDDDADSLLSAESGGGHDEVRI